MSRRVLRRVAVGLMVVIVIVLCAVGSLVLKNLGERSFRAETAVVAARAEAIRQDSLEWRAVSGQPPLTLRQQLAVSRETVFRRLNSAGDLGLAPTEVDRLQRLQVEYSTVVDNVLGLITDGRLADARRYETEAVAPAADELLDGLARAAAKLHEDAQTVSVWSDVALAAGVFVSILLILTAARLESIGRLRAQQASEARYRALIDRALDLVMVTDGEGRFLYQSPSAQRLLGDLVDTDVRLVDLVCGRSRDAVVALLSPASAGGESPALDLTFAASHLADMTYEFSGRDMCHDPLIQGVVLTGRDVTHERQLEIAKADFVATVSHELRTPLTSIRGYLEIIQSGDVGHVPEEQVPLLAIVDRNADRLLKLVHELLFLSGVDSGMVPRGSEPIDVISLVEAAMVEARPLAHAHELGLVVPKRAGAVMVRGDYGDMERMMLNLLTNAIKFSPAGGAVTVRIDLDGSDVHLRVVDQGIGICPEDRAKLFSRFFRTAEARNQQIQGTGLGLAVCKAIAEGHGGQINVQSELGEGTVFTVTLPLLQADAPNRSTEAATQPAQAHAPGGAAGSPDSVPLDAPLDDRQHLSRSDLVADAHRQLS